MRFVAGCTTCAIALVACTPASWTRAKLRPPKAGVPIDLYCATDDQCKGTARGVVTVRGGDSVDWYSVTIPDAGCTDHLALELRWEIPRENSQLALSIWADRGRVIKTMRDQESDDEESAEERDDDDDRPVDVNFDDETGELQGGRTGRITMDSRVEPGTYMIGVHARGYTGAGAYTLEVRDQIEVCNPVWTMGGWQNARDVILPRPENLAAPATTEPLVAVTSAGMSRQDRDGVRANQPTLVLDASDPRIVVGARGVIVDDRGRRVRNGTFTITSTWSPEGSTARFATARFVASSWFRRKMELGWDYWFAALDHPIARYSR